MKSLFDHNTYTDIQLRISHLNNTTTPKWGKMSVDQMLKHCQGPLKVGLEKMSLNKPNFLFKAVVRPFTFMLYNDKEWKPGLPTAKEFVVSDAQNFEQEKATLLELIKDFHGKGEGYNWPVHPIFGKFSGEQWGKMQYKHLDHHLRQFGV